MDTHGPDNGAESDAGAGGCGGCFHAWRTGPELYVAVSLATQIQFIQNMFLSAATAGLAILGASIGASRT